MKSYQKRSEKNLSSGTSNDLLCRIKMRRTEKVNVKCNGNKRLEVREAPLFDTFCLSSPCTMIGSWVEDFASMAGEKEIMVGHFFFRVGLLERENFTRNVKTEQAWTMSSRKLNYLREVASVCCKFRKVCNLRCHHLHAAQNGIPQD